MVALTRKTFWEEEFTLGDFTPVNMKNSVRLNNRKHREINIDENYITLDILLKFGSQDKMKIIPPEPKDYSGISGKG